AVTVGLTERTPIHDAEPGGRDRTGEPWTTFITRVEAAYRAELLAFLRLARGEIESPCTARDGLEASRIALAATVSRREHRPVRLPHIGWGGGRAPPPPA